MTHFSPLCANFTGKFASGKKKPITLSRIRGGVNYIGNNNYIVYPKDAQFIATNIYGATQGDITGCLRITLPVSWNNSMLSFVVSVYNYLPNTSVIYYISGYNYTGMVLIITNVIYPPPDS